MGCGYSEICAANVNSSLGGSCYYKSCYKTIAKVCDPSSNVFDAACDCSVFDIQSGGTGFISCFLYETRSSMGSFYYYGCHDEIKAQVTSTMVVEDNLYLSRGSCAEFVVGNNTPKKRNCAGLVHFSAIPVHKFEKVLLLGCSME